MAFIRRKGNAYYLVHNVRRRGKVQQLYLARLGDMPRITDKIVRQVTKKHPIVDLDWKALLEQVNNRIDLYGSDSPIMRKLVAELRTLNLSLADFFPPLLRVSEAPEVSREILMQLRLLHSTIQVKLDQFDRAPLGKAIPQLRAR